VPDGSHESSSSDESVGVGASISGHVENETGSGHVENGSSHVDQETGSSQERSSHSETGRSDERVDVGASSSSQESRSISGHVENETGSSQDSSRYSENDSNDERASSHNHSENVVRTPSSSRAENENFGQQAYARQLADEDEVEFNVDPSLRIISKRVYAPEIRELIDDTREQTVRVFSSTRHYGQQSSLKAIRSYEEKLKTPLSKKILYRKRLEMRQSADAMYIVIQIENAEVSCDQLAQCIRKNLKGPLRRCVRDVMVSCKAAYNITMSLVEPKHEDLNKAAFEQWLYSSEIAIPECSFKDDLSIVIFDPIFKSFAVRDVISHCEDPRWLSEMLLGNYY
jgi:hypothetical protein